MKKLISILLVICSLLAFSGCKDNNTEVVSDTTIESVESTWTEDEIQDDSVSGNVQTWEVTEYTDGTYFISGYNGSDKIVNVPSEINGTKVTGLTGRSFSMNSVVEEVYLPGTIVTISSNAFSECKNLRKISMPDTLQYIGDMSFAYCESLTEVVLPRDLEHIGVNAFAMCTSLKKVTFNCEKLTTISRKSFSCCYALESITIPSCVTTIEDSFFECTSLKTAYIPDTVVEMNSTFNRSPNVVIYGKQDSCAHYYALSKKHEFVAQ